MDSKTTPGEEGQVESRRGRNKLAAAGMTLTTKVLAAMVPGDELADPEHRGLRVRCVAASPTPLRVFSYRYRNAAGSLRQIEVGTLGESTLTAIRTRWEALRDRVRAGGDPRAEKVAAAALAREQVAAKKRVVQEQSLTVQKVVDQYLDEVVDVRRKAKGAAEARRLLNQLINFASWTAGQRKSGALGRRRGNLPAGVRDIASMPAKDLTREIAHSLLLAFGQGAERSGGMARQELRNVWRFAIDAGRLPGPSPFEKPPGAKTDNFGGAALQSASERERALGKAEVGLLLRWMREPGTYSRTVGDALELVLRTGLRSGEVCGIHTRELRRRDGLLWLDIPAERMKSKRPHAVPLVGRAEEIVLARMPDKTGYLFPSTRYPEKSIEQKVLGVEVFACSGRSQAAAYKHRRVCPVADFSPHDLRRTARSLLSGLGCPFEVGEAIMSHRLPGVSAVYARSDYADAKIEWLTRLGQLLDQAQAAQAKLQVAA